MTGSRRGALATHLCLVLAFLASVLLNGLHVALENHDEGVIAHGVAVSGHDDDHDDDHDHAPHDARDHQIEARPASSSSVAPQLAPLTLIAVAPEPRPTELLLGLTVDEQPLRVPDPLTHSPGRPRAPPLG